MLKYGGTVNGNVKVISAVVNIGNQSQTKSGEGTMKRDDEGGKKGEGSKKLHLLIAKSIDI